MNLSNYERGTAERAIENGYKYAARDSYGRLMFYRIMPTKIERGWSVESRYDYLDYSHKLFGKEEDFAFIKDTDKEPWELKKILREQENQKND